MKHIAIQIKKLRIETGKRQSHLAQALGISIPAYSKIETGITDINIRRLREISSYFNVEPGYFFGQSKEYEKELAKQKDLVDELRIKLINCLESRK